VWEGGHRRGQQQALEGIREQVGGCHGQQKAVGGRCGAEGGSCAPTLTQKMASAEQRRKSHAVTRSTPAPTHAPGQPPPHNSCFVGQGVRSPTAMQCTCPARSKKGGLMGGWVSGRVKWTSRRGVQVFTLRLGHRGLRGDRRVP
jgi:hypothetical protein